MAACTSGIGGKLGLVHVVAVEAAAGAGVLRGLLILVARDAGLGLERGRLVGAVTAVARLVGVRTDGGVRAL